ncbi:HD-GYP domain-containing protein [Streptomyces sp. WMMC500]|uniref:HD-GYP domain-containing protein n=1 Tax=Streptomyces sp. WMMC500 TaxID=3015154 RepID=UPI00248B7325|nr:HD-GYP domain-containing protein [Streptomyces sp. WMMC500]WBB63225.1 HD-GYP domain-containing protein [Streptomyces sp. WMMC500]
MGQVAQVSAAGRACLLCALLAAAACAAPALRPGAATPWGTVALLAGVYAAGEHLRRCPPLAGRVPDGIGAFFPVLLAGAFLLPPAAAALVPLPGALTARITEQPAAPRRLWRAAEPALASWAAAYAAGRVPGDAGLGEAGFPELLPAALLAVAAFWAVLTCLDAAMRAAAERRSPRAALAGAPAAAGAYLVHGLAGLIMAMLWHSPHGPASGLLVLLPMAISCWAFAQADRERAAHQATIRALVQAVDIKDRYTRGHSERVGRASVLIARELGMDERRQEVLRFAGILHDVGKLGVPTRILRKDGPLTPEERRVIELHPEYGHEIVRGIGFLEEVRAAILHHHERMDGRGYPYGLTGARIPEYARVVAVADAFDAMTSTRSYRRAREVPAALAELRRCAGAQFDPRMVRALAGAIERRGWHAEVTADEPATIPAPLRGGTGGAGGGAAGDGAAGGVAGSTAEGAADGAVARSGGAP